MNLEAFREGGPLHGMTSFPSFTLWKINDEGIKVPVNPRTGGNAMSNNPSTWGTFDECVNSPHYENNNGIGFIFSDADPFFFLDVDKAWDGEKWSDLAIELMQKFEGCAFELSQSNTGFHMFGMAEPLEHKKKNVKLGIELYTTGRLVCLTGTSAAGDCLFDGTNCYQETAAQYFNKVVSNNGPVLPEGPVEFCRPITDDDELIEKASTPKPSPQDLLNGTAPGPNDFKLLWEAHGTELGKLYPANDDDQEYDASSADMALANKLAFWTGRDLARMERLMRKSALKRDKWDDREDYLAETINNAALACSSVYGAYAPPPTSNESVDAGEIGYTASNGHKFMPAENQVEYFKGCTYVKKLNQVYVPDTPTQRSALLDKERFKAYYGGYEFQTGFSSQGKGSKCPWQAFINPMHGTWKQVEDAIYDPSSPPGSIVNRFGLDFVNIYSEDRSVRRRKGDPSKFTNHIEKLLPNGDDAQILMSYLAACVQYKGKKFYWAPFIQGVEGNGKSLITQVMYHALGGQHCAKPKRDDIHNKFNSWLVHRVFVAVEDFGRNNDEDFTENMKSMITDGDNFMIQAKGKDQGPQDICCNFIFVTNFKDALRITKNDRRFCVLFTAQQSREDLFTDFGDISEYFPDIYDWLKFEHGYEIVTDYLENYPIPDKFNPAKGCIRAPMTTSSDSCFNYSLGVLGDHVQYCIDTEEAGYRGNFISFARIKALLTNPNIAKIYRSPRQAEGVLNDMGYIRHPHLINGRLNNPSNLTFDPSKPIIFVKADSEEANIVNSSQIKKAYVDSNATLPVT